MNPEPVPKQMERKAHSLKATNHNKSINYDILLVGLSINYQALKETKLGKLVFVVACLTGQKAFSTNSLSVS